MDTKKLIDLAIQLLEESKNEAEFGEISTSDYTDDTQSLTITIHRKKTRESNRCDKCGELMDVVELFDSNTRKPYLSTATCNCKD